MSTLKIFVLVDGLGGNPRGTFEHLSRLLSGKEYRIILANTQQVRTHEDRVQAVLSAFSQATTTDHNADIYLVGLSAGGSAARIIAERLGNHSRLTGLIMLSPAMPRWVWFTTWTLAKVMLGHVREMILGRGFISLTTNEYLRLIAPAAGEEAQDYAGNRIGISIAEARQLAFWPPGLGVCQCPTLIIGGDQDRWISPRATSTLAVMMTESGTRVDHCIIEGAGHLVTLPSTVETVADLIKRWIELRRDFHK